eukprot:CAMPEP_0181486610 /NCGR_PEP_ID=MMETSP1110-20121109/47285_1 /TAXON_ID=174948 /ORGANISM="Symbiodinium sp., Strain CCMP421" /LENGTH=395 /DNA_ID=CAMNT_0023612877 /DNA_START=224 /DNA_END=1412 /DNA_ORIENTATION=-
MGIVMAWGFAINLACTAPARHSRALLVEQGWYAPQAPTRKRHASTGRGLPPSCPLQKRPQNQRSHQGQGFGLQAANGGLHLNTASWLVESARHIGLQIAIAIEVSETLALWLPAACRAAFRWLGGIDRCKELSRQVLVGLWLAEGRALGLRDTGLPDLRCAPRLPEGPLQVGLEIANVQVEGKTSTARSCVTLAATYIIRGRRNDSKHGASNICVGLVINALHRFAFGTKGFAVVVVTAWVVGGAVVLEVGGTGDIVVVSGNSFVVSDNSFVDSGNSVGSDSLVLVCDNSGTTLVVSTNPVVEFSGNSWLVEVSGGGVVVGASVDVTVVVVKRSHSSHDLGQCRHMYAEFSLHAPLRAQTAQKLCSSAHGPPSTSCNRSRATKQRLILPLAFVLN